MADETTSNADTKTCPECAETIKRAAKVCRYCSFRYPEATDVAELSPHATSPELAEPKDQTRYWVSLIGVEPDHRQLISLLISEKGRSQKDARKFVEMASATTPLQLFARLTREEADRRAAQYEAAGGRVVIRARYTAPPARAEEQSKRARSAPSARKDGVPWPVVRSLFSVRAPIAGGCLMMIALIPVALLAAVWQPFGWLGYVVIPVAFLIGWVSSAAGIATVRCRACQKNAHWKASKCPHCHSALP